ncbi:hypothetical protein BH10BAC1_BH10BAC1_00880 [soil metagenome]
MKKNALTFLLLTLAIASFGQSPSLTWVDQFGGLANNEFPKSITTDASGNIYTVGYFGGATDFDPGAGTTTLTPTGTWNAYILKLDGSGNFVWAKQFGGTNDTYGYSIAVDGSGNVYTTGYFGGTTDFDPNAGVSNMTASISGTDIFVSKLDASGNFVWAKQFGGSASYTYARGYGIAVDAIGDVYSTGYFQSTVDFDPGSSVSILTAFGGFNNIFISKLDASGAFVWVKQLGGTYTSEGKAITLDATGNIFTTGYFYGVADFDPGASVNNLTGTGGNAAFVSKLDASGNYVWAKQLSGSSDVYGNDIEVDATGNVYTTGDFWATADFDPSAGTTNLVSLGDDDVFISKLDASGNFVWAKQFAGTTLDKGNAIALDNTGNVYTTGFFSGTVDFDPNAGTNNLTTPTSGEDIFISKLDAAGNFLWATRFGGNSDDIGACIAIDISNNVITTGYFGAIVDFDPGTGTTNLTANGIWDIFVQKLNGGSSGIEEFSNSTLNLSVYPNPSSSLINITIVDFSKEATFQLYNLVGELILEKNVSSAQSSINIEGLADGVYFLKTYCDTKTKTVKLIKQ